MLKKLLEKWGSKTSGTAGDARSAEAGRRETAEEKEARKQHEKTLRQIIKMKTALWQDPGKAVMHLEASGEKVRGVALPTLERLLKLVPPGSSVLDVGCGHGRYSIPLAQAGHRVVGTDVSEKMLELLREKAGDIAIETRHGDAARLHAADGEFDVVFSNDFMGHFPHWPALLKEQARVCREGGMVIFSTSCAEHRETVDQWGGNEFHYAHSPDIDSGMPFWAEVSREELRRAGAEAGLELESIYPIRFFWPSFLLGRAMGDADYDAFQKELKRRLSANEEVLKFFSWLEVTALQRLPLGMSFMILVVMRKGTA